MRQVVGNIDGNDVIYNTEDETVFCKNTELPYKLLRKVFDSSLNRVKIKDDLYYIDHGFNMSIGCLKLDKNKYKEMINNIEKIKLNYEKRNH